ncbi:PAS domain S-box protein [Methanoculleus sp. Wushi-C6]|uniref:histidine kinase n=1 Tax=Methanoculleus caldifontis TaxID=2651577 RepID=A0ABU3X3F8_9EURY|nr:PAS domain S-box protein [Methanoculleus sp. Wushi-C6]MDV2482132.1 PAS domain S-box protein [Methanoculleus sp. Wushi-C6]
MDESRSVYGDIPALSAILDALGEGLLVVGPDNRIACASRHLGQIFGIDRDTLGGTDADLFVRQVLAPRISGTSSLAGLAAFISGRLQTADIPCTLLSAGGEEKFCCSCRVVDEEPLRGMRVVRLLPDTSGSQRGSGRRWIEEALRQNEDWHRFLVENLNEGFGLIDREGVAVFANRRMAEIVGYPVADIIGAPVSAFVDGEGARCLNEYLKSLDQAPHEVFEIDLIRKGGARVHTLMATTPILDASGACRGFLAGVQDITPLKRMEIQLRESEEKYRSLVELSAEATLIHRDGTIVYVNPAGVRLLDARGPDEIVGRAVLDIVHPEARDLIRALSVRDLLGEETPLVEIPILRPDGTTVPVEGRGTRTLFEGRPAVQVVVRDVTYRKQAEERLQASNRHLLLLNRIVGTSASAKTPGELLETALDQTLDLLGYDGGAVYLPGAGRRGIALLHERDMPGACRELAVDLLEASWTGPGAALPCYLESGGSPGTPDSCLLRDFGFAALACVPLVVEPDTVGALLIGNRERVSFSPEERALLEAIGREIGVGILRGMLYQRLEAANREANLYLDILTHDIRNADNVANIYADILIGELDGEPARHARKLKDGIRKSIEITANVATIRKIHKSRTGLAPLDLDAVVRDEIAHYPDLRIAYDGLPVQVLADDLLPEVLTNLIGNTAKHGGPGVEVTISVEDLDGEVRISVADTGPGIPDEAKEAIFYRFEREGGRRGSQGLGLSICRMLTARYGGRIWVEDRVRGHPEQGATFRFTLRNAGRGGSTSV